MAYTETTTQSWGSRLGDSLKGVIIGVGLFIAAFPLLFWNEGNSVKTAEALDEGEKACQEVGASDKVNPDYNAQLVWMTGKADTKEVLTDETFGLSLNAIALRRKTEMYQWKENCHTEEKKNTGGSVTTTKTYTYEKVWSSTHLKSGSYKESGHDNPSTIEFPSQSKLATQVTFGAFRLNESQIKMIGSAQDYSFPQDFTCRVSRVQMAGTTIYVPNRETRNNALNNRDVASEPRIGDMRITFEVIYPHDISVVAKQQGDTFVPYRAKSKKTVNLLADGEVDAATMFQDARDANTMMTWMIRFGGFMMMFIGLKMFFKPLSVLGDVLPFLGNLLEMGTGLVAGFIAGICWLITVAIAWLVYRPLLGIALLAVAGGLIWLLRQKRKAKAASSATTATIIAFILCSLSAQAETSITKSCVTLDKVDASEVPALVEKHKALGKPFSLTLDIRDCDNATLAAAATAWADAKTVMIADSRDKAKLTDLSPIANFKNATRVTLTYIDADLAPLATLPAKELALRYSKLKNLAPIASMPSLQALDCYGSEVESFAPLADAKQLQTIGFYAVVPLGSGEACYSSLGKLKQVKNFHGGLTKMTSLEWLKEVPQAEELKIFSESIGSFEPITALPNLKYIRIWNMKATRLSSAFGSLKVLANAKKLTKLEVPGSEVTDFDVLGTLPELKLVDLTAACDVDLGFVKNLTKLEDLRLPDDRKKTIKVTNFEALFNHPSIRRVNIGRCANTLPVAGLENCPNLRSVSVVKDHCTKEEGAALQEKLKAHQKSARVTVR